VSPRPGEHLSPATRGRIPQREPFGPHSGRTVTLCISCSVPLGLLIYSASRAQGTRLWSRIHTCHGGAGSQLTPAAAAVRIPRPASRRGLPSSARPGARAGRPGAATADTFCAAAGPSTAATAADPVTDGETTSVERPSCRERAGKANRLPVDRLIVTRCHGPDRRASSTRWRDRRHDPHPDAVRASVQRRRRGGTRAVGRQPRSASSTGGMSARDPTSCRSPITTASRQASDPAASVSGRKWDGL